VSGYLKQKMAVAPFVQDLTRLGTLYGQPAQHERSGSEPEILRCLMPLQADASDGVGTPELLLRDDQARKVLPQNVAAPGEPARHTWHIPVTRVRLSSVDLCRKGHASPPTTAATHSRFCDVFVPTDIPDGTRWDRKYRPKPL
jgi:hypothetical protein